MVKLTEDFIFRLKTICDITTIVSNYVELKFSGKNKKCCCPFHSEKTPSFVVFEETSSFYCFGCGVGGDVITFIEKIENLDYIAAVKFLAKYAGLELPEKDFDDEKSRLRSKILEINKVAARFFFNNLAKKEGLKGAEYFLKERRLSKKTIVKFGLGYALDSWDSLRNFLKEKGYSYKEMLACDLVLKSKKGTYYDKFRNRAMFPIIDLKGDVVGFGGRSISKKDQPKYLNSSDTLVFKKSLGLFGLNFAKNSEFESFLLCEGYLDVLTLHQNGFDSAVATLGTSLTKEQVRLIARHSKDVVLAYDMDMPGQIAADRAFSLFEEIGFKTKILKFFDAKDPDEYINRFGSKRFKMVLENAIAVEKLKLENLLKKYDLNDLEQKKQYVNKYCEVIAQFKNPLKREIYVGELCQSLNLDRSLILNHIKFIENKNRKKLKKKIDFNRNFRLEKNLPNKVFRAEEGVLRFLYYNPDKVDLITKKVQKEHFNVDWHKKLFSFLVELIKNKNSLDFSFFREVLNEEQLGNFSKIINLKNIYRNIVLELENFCKILKEFYEKKTQDIKTMSLDELEKKRREKAELKR